MQEILRDSKVKALLQEASKSTYDFVTLLIRDWNTGEPIDLTYPQKLFLMEEGYKNVWLCWHRRAGKCIDETSEIYDADTGQIVKIGDAENVKNTLAYDLSVNSTVKVGCKRIFNGVKPCIGIKTTSGKCIILTKDHLLFKQGKGWVSASTIRSGDRLLAPTKIELFGNLNPSEDTIDTTLEEAFNFLSLPDRAFKFSKVALVQFLKLFWSRYARLVDDKIIRWVLPNKELCTGFSKLFLRLGIDTLITEDNELYLVDPIDIELFMVEIGLLNVTSDAKNPRTWLEVTSIFEVGERRVYDLEINHPNHCFIANNMVVHNSTAFIWKMLYYACTSRNATIQYFVPSTKQLDSLFPELDLFLNASPILKAFQAPIGNTNDPYLRTFITGSTIKGNIIANNDDSAGKIRGLNADFFFGDEVQEFEEVAWKAVNPIASGNVRRPCIQAHYSGTINKPSGYFYETVFYRSRTKEFPASKSKLFFIPVDKNPEYSARDLEEKRANTPHHEWHTEWLLQPATSSVDVFRVEDVTNSFNQDYEFGPHLINTNCHRFITVDWDKKGTGTNIAVFQYSVEDDTLTLINREEVGGEFTYMVATERVISLASEYKVSAIGLDFGQGETQYEILKSHFSKDPHVRGRVFQITYHAKFDYPDIDDETKTVKMDTKNYLINQLKRRMQERKLVCPAGDEIMRSQFFKYKVTKQLAGGRKQYSSKDEHLIDLCAFSCFIIYLVKYQGLDLSDQIELIEYNTAKHELPVRTQEISSIFADVPRPDFEWGPTNY